jgi:hypothetical protein
MPSGRLIVCEKTGSWAHALRQAMPGGGRVYETRSLSECWDELSRSPASFVAIELTAANCEPLLKMLARVRRHYPAARVAIVAGRVMQAYQWVLREAGAIHFACSPRRLATVVQLAERHLAAVPDEELSLTERILDRLPWKSA